MGEQIPTALTTEKVEEGKGKGKGGSRIA